MGLIEELIQQNNPLIHFMIPKLKQIVYNAYAVFYVELL